MEKNLNLRMIVSITIYCIDLKTYRAYVLNKCYFTSYIISTNIISQCIHDFERLTSSIAHIVLSFRQKAFEIVTDHSISAIVHIIQVIYSSFLLILL